MLVISGLAGGAIFIRALRPAAAGHMSLEFQIASGDGFADIADRLGRAGIIRSSQAFRLFGLATAKAWLVKPGHYVLDAHWSAPGILDFLVAGPTQVKVTIPEGSSVFETDAILSHSGIFPAGALVKFAQEQTMATEGYLFPDTYFFFPNTSVAEVVKVFKDTFQKKTAILTEATGSPLTRADVILASLVEKEVADPTDKQIVAGILKKRLAADMPLQVDATICYIKKVKAATSEGKCYPLTSLDFKEDFPYNTYLYRGLPPGPIASPGLLSLKAVLHSRSSPYWFYLSNPANGKTVFSATLGEHERFRALYLRVAR